MLTKQLGDSHSYSVGLLYCDYQAFCRERQIEPVPLEHTLRIDMLGRSACVSKAGGSGMILQSPQQHSARYRQTHQAEMAARRAGRRWQRWTFLTPTLPPRDATDCAGNALRNALTRPF